MQSERSIVYDALGAGVTFVSAPLDLETEITGPLAAKLFVSSSTADADMFVVFRVFTPDMREVVFMGAIDPHTPIAQGWLRASHRKLDPTLSTEYRPYHAHDESQPLKPDEIVPLDIELWPTSIVVPSGHRLALTVRARDYEWAKRPERAYRISRMSCAAADRFCTTIHATAPPRYSAARPHFTPDRHTHRTCWFR